MDRLFGVTMQERGVSKLVSVDLQAAERLAAALTRELFQTLPRTSSPIKPQTQTHSPPTPPAGFSRQPRGRLIHVWDFGFFYYLEK